MTSLKDKVVIITGAGAGIGRAAALRFAESEATVVVTGRRSEPLRILVEGREKLDFVLADAANPDDAPRLVETVIKRWGRLDVLVNNAGAGTMLPLEHADLGAIAGMFAVNVFGPSLLATAALPHLKVAGGSIVNVSSTFGHKAAGALSHYAASKAALEHMTRCSALELADHRIRVNAVAAGPTETDFLRERMGLSDEQVESVKAQERSRIPLQRRGLPDDVAAWIVLLASDAASWITGQVITVDGGLSIT
ncbi:SDR family oxidoreductase [uncultured Paludibaculum sp.]|uniref:SDR family NAD(P)-dependent oxidoreductase n=1 Tax=uncultured Paludibaculum sp. TaxID=1765020 RepID=UPI002AAAB8E5|nr:SDR family oxidoreductase [uncultured Paludibaculum sp.]